MFISVEAFIKSSWYVMLLSKLSLMLGFLAASSPYIAVLGYSFISDYSLRLYVVFSVAGLYMALLEVALFSWAASMLFFLLQTQKRRLCWRVAPYDHEKYSVF